MTPLDSDLRTGRLGRPGRDEKPMRRLLRATINSWHGLIQAARSEAAFRQEVAVFLVGVPVAFVVTAEPWKRYLLIGVLLFVLVVELLNTAIEKLADRLTTDHDPQIGRVKDLGSAAVGVALIVGALFWVFAIAERIGAI